MENNFASNLKHLRLQSGMTQEELAKKLDKDYSTIGKWELGQRSPIMTDVIRIAELFNISLEKLIGQSIIYDNAEQIELDANTIKIPVLGTIKAGLAIEAQQDILEYVEIPEDWTRGGKQFYGLKISGDSMYPKYSENDIVIFEQTEDYTIANNKDCAVMVNGFDATFKNVTISENGVTLVPFNLNNSDGYQPTFYNKEQISSLPVKIIGIAREKRTRLWVYLIFLIKIKL